LYFYAFNFEVMKNTLIYILLLGFIGLNPVTTYAQKSKAKAKPKAQVQQIVEPLKLGQLYEGGVIFSLSNDKLSGKVISKEALPFPGIKSWDDAKKLCESYKGGKVTGWRMPTVEEMSASHYVLKTAPNVVQGHYSFVSSSFWTSSPGKKEDMYFVFDYTINRGYMQSKDRWNNVRPVRDFTVK
jgi:hypothetical protein